MRWILAVFPATLLLCLQYCWAKDVASSLGHTGPAFEAGATPSSLGWGEDSEAYPERFVVNLSDGAELVWVPAGEFMMGSTAKQNDELWAENGWSSDRPTNEPAHRVWISQGFWMYKHEVSNGQYTKFLAATGHDAPDGWEHFRQFPTLPVAATWDDCEAYAEWASGRLPTEAEWEWAARGPEGRQYPWGDAWDRAKCCCAEFWAGRSLNSDDMWKTWFDATGIERLGAVSDWSGVSSHIKEVGSFPQSTSWCGALDMAGNVWEWCADWYGDYYYAASPWDDPRGPTNGQMRVMRGGSWFSYGGDNCRSASRGRYYPDSWGVSFGFRPVACPSR